MGNLTERQAARKSMGFCLQQNVLYDSLTVADHLQFIAMLRGIPCSKMNFEVSHFLIKVVFTSYFQFNIIF